MTHEVSALNEMPSLAQQYGPYFFAVLFVLVLTRIAYRSYMHVRERQPPASDADIKIMRGYFIGTVAFGILCSASALGWWFFSNSRQSYTYKVTITGVMEPVTLTSSGKYYKPTPRQTVSGGPAVVDDEFLIVREKPFTPGDKFEFDVWIAPARSPDAPPNAQLCGGGIGVVTHETVTATYHGSTEDQFKLLATPDKPASLVVAESGSRRSSSRFGQGQVVGPLHQGGSVTAAVTMRNQEVK